jgi:lactococcin 972 family bacteriocin
MLTSRTGRSTLAAVALTMATAIPALATTANVSGGTWNYGTSDSRVWSDYYHGVNCHSSSVEGSSYVNSGNVGAKKYSRASSGTRWWATDRSYYRPYC